MLVSQLMLIIPAAGTIFIDLQSARVALCSKICTDNISMSALFSVYKASL